MKPFFPSKIAEFIFAACLLVFAINHFKHTDMMGGMVPSFMPGDGKIWVYVSGAGLTLAAIAIITGIQKTLACYLLAALLLIFVFTIHLKPAMDGNTGGLLKDTSMAMCAILIGNGSKSS
jgi:uncharacterized membrane protein